MSLLQNLGGFTSFMMLTYKQSCTEIRIEFLVHIDPRSNYSIHSSITLNLGEVLYVPMSFTVATRKHTSLNFSPCNIVNTAIFGKYVHW